MSCLNLKRLLPHKKMWKLFTNKLHLKLIRSKTSKKPKPRRSFKASKKVCWPSLSIQPKKFKNHHWYLQRRPPPVFVDQLYVEPVSLVKGHVGSPGASKGKPGSSKSENVDGKSSRPESSGEETGVVSADDAWESVAMASPQMHEINERAEEFIARFRAQMQEQEMLARRL